MNRPAVYPTSTPRSRFDRTFSALANLLDELLNQVFALNHETAQLRSMVIRIGFFVLWVVLALTTHPAQAYQRYSNNFINLLADGDPIAFLVYVGEVFFSIFLNLVLVRHLLAIYVPFWLMQRVAAVYLADIFEKDEKTAHTFILQAALARAYNTIHISQGKVADGDQSSPIIQIGGPGYVVVELDSAVILEKPDGSARVIGPTTKTLHKEKFVTGFERIRQGLDLRDIIQKQDITTRSRDGIPVSARDVQYIYSIYRGHRPVKTAQTPYPFDENAAKNLVYGASRAVKLGEVPKPTQDWLEPLPGKILGQIGGEMGGFINSRGLSEFLAAVGKLENDNLSERKKETEERIRSLGVQPDQSVEEFAGSIQDLSEGSVPPSRSSSSPSEFISRSNLTNMFYDNFQSKAAQRGIQLNWIGVGTWDTPAQIIPKNHLEAWKISRENFARGNPAELQRIRQNVRLQELIRLTEEVAIRKLYNEYDMEKPDEQVIISVLKEYLNVLEMARDYYSKINIPDDILDAIHEIERWVYPPYHPVGEE